MITKKDQTKKNNKKDINLLDESITVRFPKKEYEKRKEFIFNIGYCQICNKEYDLDHPHHALFGNAKKDDRTLICICCDCHRILHNKGFKKLDKTREETVEIGFKNNKLYLGVE